MFEFMKGRWTPETAGTATWPALHVTNYAINYANSNVNTFLLQDASYLKIRNAQLSWLLPSEWTKKIKLPAVKVFVNGQNLHTWTNYRFGFDPELNATNAYPTARVYNFGVNIKF
jgi:hypothetical protein